MPADARPAGEQGPTRPDLEDIRKRHQRAGRGYRGTENHGCVGCSDVYPCGAEQAIAYALALEAERTRLLAVAAAAEEGLKIAQTDLSSRGMRSQVIDAALAALDGR